MSKTTTYKAVQDGLVHGAHFFQVEVDTWCGDTYVIEADHVRGRISDNAVITCVVCLTKQLRWQQHRAAELAIYKTDIRGILVANSVKDLQEAEDAKATTAVDAVIGAALAKTSVG